MSRFAYLAVLMSLAMPACFETSKETTVERADDEGKKKTRKKKGKAAPKQDGVRDWSKEGLRTVSNQAGTFGFSIDLPKDLGASSAGIIVPYRSARWGKGLYTDVEVSVHMGQVPPSLDSVARNVGAKDPHVLTKKELPDGFLVTHHDAKKTKLQTTLWRLRSGSDKGKSPKSLACIAKQHAPEGVPSFEATARWMEKVCGTLAFKSD